MSRPDGSVLPRNLRRHHCPGSGHRATTQGPTRRLDEVPRQGLAGVAGEDNIAAVGAAGRIGALLRYPGRELVADDSLRDGIMDPTNRSKLADRIARAAEAALAAQGYVSPLNVLCGIGWLSADAEKRWRQGQVDALERVSQTSLPRIAEAMHLFRAWATQRGLRPSETQYVARTPQRQTLRFSVGGDPGIERWYRTHWVSPDLSEKKRERLAEKASRPPDLVVIQPLNAAWTCHRCGGSGDLLIMEGQGPACLRCAGLDDLAFLPTGDVLLTRRSKARSARFAVVVRFSRSRDRYERQGLLVEPQAMAEVEREVAAQRDTKPPSRRAQN
jgi:hypothetical protein